MGCGGNKNLKPHQTKNRKILVLCPFPIGLAAGQRLKYEQYFPDWRSLGYQVDVSSFMDLRMWNVVYLPGYYFEKLVGVLRGQMRRFKDLFRINNYDIVYVFMWVTPLGTSAFERLVRLLAKRLVYDIEDNVLVGQANVARQFNPNRWISFLKGPGKQRFLIATADHVITSSPFLNALCLETNTRKSCTYISSSVDTEYFSPSPSYSKDNQVVIGWTGTFSSMCYLDMLRTVFLRLTKRVDFKLKVIGNFDYELPGVHLEVVRWTKDSEVAELRSIDIGVYPLPIDEWVLGKSGLKAIQYMALGLPTVATKVGTTPLLITHGVDGLLVESEEEWVMELERLVRDSELRRELGKAAREKVVQKYSVRGIRRNYRKVLSLVMEDAKV